MRKIIKVTLLFLFLSWLIGCASPNMRHSVPADDTLISNQDKALVYFIRPSKLGFQISAAVYDNENFIGIVPYQQKLPYLADPGEHLFMIVSEAADFLKADLLPGRTYYIKVDPRMGAWRARFSLAPVTKDDLNTKEVRKWIEKARMIKNKDSAYEWAKNSHDNVLSKKAEYLPKWQSKSEDSKPFLRPEDGM